MAGTAFATSNWSGYVLLTIANPDVALLDFSLIVPFDILPAGFGSAVQSDGGDVRATKADDTELPIDIIEWNYNAGNPTGTMRVKWSGTLASTGTQQIKIWAGYSGGTATQYDATETYGQYNAYDSNWLFNCENGGEDRLGLSTTAIGGVTVGGVAGPNGEAATFFDGSNDGVYSTLASPPDLSNATIMSFFKPVTGQAARILNIGSSSSNDQYIAIDAETGKDFTVWNRFNGVGSLEYTTEKPVNGVWSYFAGVFQPAGLKLYINGVLKDSGSFGSRVANADIVGIGYLARRSSLYGQTTLCHAQAHLTDRATQWIAEEYDQLSSPATFWTVGEWTGTGEPPTVIPTPYYSLFLRGVV